MELSARRSTRQADKKMQTSNYKHKFPYNYEGDTINTKQKSTIIIK